MADSPSPTPALHNSDKQSSPSKAKYKPTDVHNLAAPYEPNADVDRQIEVWDSMDLSILTTPEDFEKCILWPEANGDIPKPPRKATATMTEAMNKLFYTEKGTRREKVSEDQIANAIIKGVINKIALPGTLRGALSQNNYCTTDPTRCKVDAALYPSAVLPQNGRPDWTHLRLFIEFKQGGTANDPFDDKSDHPEAWAQSRQDVRGQLLAYASNTFQYQHRTALFSLLINGDEFRGMYWDRSGLIVTNAINYLENPDSLLQFLWAFASLSGEQQGIDPTATLLTKDSEHYKLMDSWALDDPALDMPFHERADVSDKFAEHDTAPLGPADSTRLKTSHPSQPLFKYVREDFRKSLVEGWPRYRVLVGEDKHEFLIAHPVFTATSMFGRGTRGYIACDIKNNKFVWLKDSWRPFYEGVEPEGKYLETMASKPGLKLTVPTVVAHGDVLQQTTYAAEYMKDEQTPPVSPPAESASSESTRGKKRPREEEEQPVDPESVREARLFIHYRLAVEEICLKMGYFTSGKHLVQLVLDCIYTHRDAYIHFDLLHRDISTGNMLILPKIETGRRGKRRVRWRGLLTDWELAKYVPKGSALQRARQPERTGTWQFMSVDSVEHPERPVGVADDLESFFHVLLHHSIRYVRHTLTDHVTSFITDYFDTFRMDEKSRKQVCSAAKVSAVRRGELCMGMTDLVFLDGNDFPNHPLNNLFRSWLELHVARYRILSQTPKDRTVLGSSNDAARCAQEVADASDSEFSDDPDSSDDDSDYGDDPNNDGATTTNIRTPAVGAAEDSSGLTKKRAAQLDTHLKTVRIFQRYLRKFPWPADHVGDQLATTYNPKKQIVAMKASMMSNFVSGRVSASSKKARTESSVAAGPSGSGFAPVPEVTPQAALPRNTTRPKRCGMTQERLTRARRTRQAAALSSSSSR